MKTTIYVLRLQNGKYYVGKSDDPIKRYEEHMNGKGSTWTRKYKPIGIEKIINNASPFDEDKVTKEMMAKHGIDNVRGGVYVTEDLDDIQEKNLRREIWGAQDCCIRCGRKGHFVANCYAKTDVNDYDLDESSSEDEISKYIVKQSESPVGAFIKNKELVKKQESPVGAFIKKTERKIQQPVQVLIKKTERKIQ